MCWDRFTLLFIRLILFISKLRIFLFANSALFYLISGVTTILPCLFNWFFFGEVFDYWTGNIYEFESIFIWRGGLVSIDIYFDSIVSDDLYFYWGIWELLLRLWFCCFDCDCDWDCSVLFKDCSVIFEDLFSVRCSLNFWIRFLPI